MYNVMCDKYLNSLNWFFSDLCNIFENNKF